MIRAGVILMLLSVAVPLKLEDEYEEPEDSRSVPPKMEVPRLSLTNNKANASAAMRHASQRLKEETALLLQAIEACRETLPRVSNRTFNLQLYGGLMGDLLGAKSDAYKSALRRCNISEHLVSKLKADLSQLDKFQDVFVLLPRNDSSKSPGRGKPTQQPNLPPSRKNSRKNLHTTALESNLNLNMGEEWHQVAPKVSYMSHIYLGSSIYPIMTEESRVLNEDMTPPSPSATEAPVPKEMLAPSGWVPSLPWREPYRLTRTFRRQGNTSAGLRAPRSVPRGSERGENRPDVPFRLSLLPPGDQKGKEKITECGLDMKKFEDGHYYRMIQKLSVAILRNFKRFLKGEILKRKTDKSL